MTAASPELPATVRAALEAALDRVSRQALRDAVEGTSRRYRAGGHSDQAVRTDLEALAYVVARMPATYAATRQVLAEAKRQVGDFAPHSLIDVGAGPGTATLAALETWSTLATADLVERNAALVRMSQQLIGPRSVTTRIRALDARMLQSEAPADVVLASYVLAEQDEADARQVVSQAIGAARGMLVLVEPGSRHGFARIRAARDVVAAAGWLILAPCPHMNPCPLTADDWCHFSVRLPRSRAHREIKGGTAPYEDEPFSYLVAIPRDAAPGGVSGGASHGRARVLRPPEVRKGDIALDLCGPDGRTPLRIPRRDRPAYKAALKLSAGDMWPADLA